MAFFLIGPEHVYNVERTASVYLLQFSGGGGAPEVPTTGQIWPRGA